MSCNSENSRDQDRVIQQIESYREKPVLQNPTAKSYFNKIKINDSDKYVQNIRDHYTDTSRRSDKIHDVSGITFSRSFHA